MVGLFVKCDEIRSTHSALFGCIDSMGDLWYNEGGKMLEDLQKCCNNLKILGHFEKEILIKYGFRLQWPVEEPPKDLPP